MVFGNLDTLIRSKLGLYTDIRSVQEDDALYEEAYNRLVEETLQFIAENNSSFSISQSTLPTQSSLQSLPQKMEALVKDLEAIDDWEFRLTKRLTYYLNNWLLTI